MTIMANISNRKTITLTPQEVGNFLREAPALKARIPANSSVHVEFRIGTEYDGMDDRGREVVKAVELVCTTEEKLPL